MSNIDKFSIREWLALQLLLPIFLGAVGCRRNVHSVVVHLGGLPPAPTNGSIA